METGLKLLRLRWFLGVRDKILFQFVVVRPPAGGLTFREIWEQKAECWYLAAGRCSALHCLLCYRCTWLHPPLQYLSWFPANFHQSRQARSESPLSPRGNVFLGLGSHLLTSDSGFKFLTNTLHTSYSLNLGTDSAEPKNKLWRSNLYFNLFLWLFPCSTWSKLFLIRWISIFFVPKIYCDVPVVDADLLSMWGHDEPGDAVHQGRDAEVHHLQHSKTEPLPIACAGCRLTCKSCPLARDPDEAACWCDTWWRGRPRCGERGSWLHQPWIILNLDWP